MPDFNIPDGPPGESYEDQYKRVRRHIPGELVALWKSIVDPDDAPEDGWPEMVATFLQLIPSRVQACMGAMAMIHLVRSGGSMMKLQSSTIAMSMARGEPGMTILAKAYAAAKMTAILASGDLRRNEAILPAVARLMTLIEKAHDASAQLSSDASSTPREPHAAVLRTIARELNAAAVAVEADLGGSEPAPTPPPSSIPDDLAQATMTREILKLMTAYVAFADSRNGQPPSKSTFGSLHFPETLHLTYATGSMIANLQHYEKELADKLKDGDLLTSAPIARLVGECAVDVISLMESAQEAAHALADASIETSDPEKALKWGGVSVELAKSAAAVEKLVTPK